MMITDDINASCPFCGSPRTVTDHNAIRVGTNGLDYTVYRVKCSVRCTICHARGPVVSGKVFSLERYPIDVPFELPEWATTWQKLKAEAESEWKGAVSI